MSVGIEEGQMSSGGLSKAGLEQMHEVMAAHVERGSVPGLVWLFSRRGEVHVGEAGAVGADDDFPVAPDTIFRISSMTKPVTAVAAMILVEECRLRLDDPVDPWLAELADRRVLTRPTSALDDTVAAYRPITLRDLLTSRMGLGLDFTDPGPRAVIERMAELGLGVGPPSPAGVPEPDEWMRRIATVPLMYQPGERWLYHTSADVLGVLVARAAGQSLESFLAERIFDPLGMTDTGFHVPARKLNRFGPCYWTDRSTGARQLYDRSDGQWSHPPAFASGGAGLVSTINNYRAFAEMLASHGVHRGQRILSRPSVEVMTANHLTDAQLATSSPDGAGALGWGFGLGVQVRRVGPTRSVGTYGWDGGLGSQWANDPVEGIIGILMTSQAWTSPVPPPVHQDFWTCIYAAIED
jgi:CubicO group peptidase (beta-lactamase class C family)